MCLANGCTSDSKQGITNKITTTVRLVHKKNQDRQFVRNKQQGLNWQ